VTILEINSSYLNLLDAPGELKYPVGSTMAETSGFIVQTADILTSPDREQVAASSST